MSLRNLMSAVLIMPLPATACSTAHNDFREQAESVVRYFLEAVIAGDADLASS